MPVVLNDEDVAELRTLLHDLVRNPFAGGEIQALGLRALLSRELLAKLCIQVPENKASEMMYKPPKRAVGS